MSLDEKPARGFVAHSEGAHKEPCYTGKADHLRSKMTWVQSQLIPTVSHSSGLRQSGKTVNTQI